MSDLSGDPWLPRLQGWICPIPWARGQWWGQPLACPTAQRGVQDCSYLLEACFVLIILFFAFPKFSHVLIHVSNPFLMNCSINDVHEKPQPSLPKNLNFLWQLVSSAAILLLPFSWCCIWLSKQSIERQPGCEPF